ncbi:hypothetical protein GXN76_14390 [Kroppenstedtia pulmonis]|uniref:Uncharacterized protein n=1 Tax=Kroppenstedtia pulmonis TaxID=1380685 RepID=A0A7D3Y3E8_9BACL|nr:hypothetical protein [Kroppenstedtia pulmonis]QKG85523.1 hypothetical protein GXN76_14390 [Kroppenstedtia pulmonis]
MKRSIMIWVISGIVYLGIVITGYSVYKSMNPDTVYPENNQEKENVYQNLSHDEHAGI